MTDMNQTIHDASAGIRLSLLDMTASMRVLTRGMKRMARAAKPIGRTLRRFYYDLPELERKADTMYWQRRLR